MANITLAGTLRDPNGDLAVGDKIRFTHKSTTGETVKSASSILTIDPTGVYSIDLEYGLVLVEYKDARNSQFENLGVATVNGTNPATTIPELLNALVPVSSAELIEFQAILADCVAAKVAAEAAAATLDLINDLSQAYIFDTVALFKDSAIVFPDGKTIHLNDRDADFIKSAGTTADTLDIIASTSVNQKITLINHGNIVNIGAYASSSVALELSSGYTGDIMKFLPTQLRAGVQINKTKDGYSYVVDGFLFIGSGSITLFISNGGNGGGLTINDPMSWDLFNTNAVAGNYSNAGSLRINLIDNIYDRHTTFDTFSSITGTRIHVRSICGGSWLTTKEQLTWSQQSAGVFTANVPTAGYQIRMLYHQNDTDSYDMPVMHEQVADEASLTPRTWCQVGTKVTVKLLESSLSLGIVGITPIRTINKYKLEFDNAVLFEDIGFCYGGTGVYISSPNLYPVVFKDCKFLGGAQDGFGTTAITQRVFSLGSINAWAGKDGFNYHAVGVVAEDDVSVVEVNTRAYNAGLIKYVDGNSTTNSNNGSTAHDSISVWRFGCKYWNCEGPVVADIDGCKSNNYDLDVGSCLITGTGRSSGFYTVQTGGAAWAPKTYTLIDCKFNGLYIDAAVTVEGDATVNLQNLYADSLSVKSTSTIIEITNE